MEATVVCITCIFLNLEGELWKFFSPSKFSDKDKGTFYVLIFQFMNSYSDYANGSSNKCV